MLRTRLCPRWSACSFKVIQSGLRLNITQVGLNKLLKDRGPPLSTLNSFLSGQTARLKKQSESDTLPTFDTEEDPECVILANCAG